MIPEFCLLQWRDTAPWKENYQVEQDLIISRALVSLYSNDFIKEKFGFRGGTALNKLFFNPSSRYSEDIDLVQLDAEPIGDSINIIRKALEWLGEPQRKLTERSAKLTYRFITDDNIPKKLKIEINTTEHFKLYELEHYQYSVDNPWFTGNSMITTYNINELMATKLRALYQRRKGRDLFDLWFALKNNMIDCNIMIDGFKKYCQKDGLLITRAIFEKNFYDKIHYKEFEYDITSLLPKSASWSLAESEMLVRKQIIELL